MTEIARIAEDLQTLLGEHQGATVSATFVARIIANGNGQTAQSGFTFGVLMANELQRAAEIRKSLKN